MRNKHGVRPARRYSQPPRANSREVAAVKAARALLKFVRREIARGVALDDFSFTRPAALADELTHFLAVYDR